MALYLYIVDANDCAGNPCNNGGVCMDGIATYTCTCSEGFNGSDCETSIFYHQFHTTIGLRLQK